MASRCPRLERFMATHWDDFEKLGAMVYTKEKRSNDPMLDGAPLPKRSRTASAPCAADVDSVLSVEALPGAIRTESAAVAHRVGTFEKCSVF